MISKMELREVDEKSLLKTKKIFSGVHFSKTLILITTFFISRATIMDGLTPFSIALISAYLLTNNSANVMGIVSTIGIISVQGISSYNYLIPTWLVIGVYKLLKDKVKYSTFKMGLLSSVMLLISKSTIILLKDFYLYDLVMTGFECIIVFSLTYIFSYSIPVFEENKGRLFTSEELICGAIMLALTVSGVQNINILGLSLKNIVAVLLVILFAYIKGPTLGTTVGVTVGLVTSMSEPNMPLIISTFGFAGLLSGLFRDLGKLGSIMGFLLGNGIMLFYINGFAEPLVHLKEVIAAGLILIVFSKPFNTIIQKIKMGTVEHLGEETYKSKIKGYTYKRLKEAAQVFEELSSTIKRAADRERIIDQKDISKIIDQIANDVCKDCSMKPFCWGNDFYKTYHSMFEVMEIIDSDGSVNEETLPDNIKKRCIKHNKIIQRSNYLFELYKINYKWESEILECRQLVSQQIEGVAKIIDNLAKDIYKDIFFKQDVEREIFIQLKNSGFGVKEVTVAEGENDNYEIFIEMKSCLGKRNCIDNIVPIVSNIAGFELTSDKFSCNLQGNSKRCRFKLIRANKFGAVTKVATAKESFNYISGDSYTFSESDGSYFVALSDGMGVGLKANQESDIAISLLEKFIEAGFDRELALKTINSILILKSNDEMFATLDMSLIDLYRGKTKFIKLGAAPTFIKKKDRVEIINSQTLPMGIFGDVDFQVFEGELDDGDLIIMMSDGVLDANREAEDKEIWMKNVIQEIESFNPQKIADKIVDVAKKSSQENVRDDMTVLVTKVWKRQKN